MEAPALLPMPDTEYTYCCSARVASGRSCCRVAKYVYGHAPVCGIHARQYRQPAVSQSRSNGAVAFPRCTGITKAGHRCKRLGSMYCNDESRCASHKVVHVSSELNTKLQEDCPICFNSLSATSVVGSEENRLAMTHCGHLFHKNCIMTWRNSEYGGNSCPLCRRNTNIHRGRRPVLQKICTVIEHF